MREFVVIRLQAGSYKSHLTYQYWSQVIKGR